MALGAFEDGKTMEWRALYILVAVGLGLLFSMAVNDATEWAVPAPTYPITPVTEEACTEAGGTWETDPSEVPYYGVPMGDVPVDAGSCETPEVIEYEGLQAVYDFWRPLIVVAAGALALMAALLVVQLSSVVRLGLALGGALLLASIGALPSFLSVYLPTAIPPSPESAFAAYGWGRPLVEAVAFIVLAWAAKRSQRVITP